MWANKKGYSLEDFYPSNDTDVVHFRWLHKILRKVSKTEFSNIHDKFVENHFYQGKQSTYAGNTYEEKFTTLNDRHEPTDHVVKPYIDDQLAEHFRQVIKPELDRLNSRVSQLESEVSTLTNRVRDLENK